MAGVIQNDLEGSGALQGAAPRDRMPANPARAEDVAAPAWKAAGADYVVVGRVTALEGGKLQVDYRPGEHTHRGEAGVGALRWRWAVRCATPRTG